MIEVSYDREQLSAAIDDFFYGLAESAIGYAEALLDTLEDHLRDN